MVVWIISKLLISVLILSHNIVSGILGVACDKIKNLPVLLESFNIFWCNLARIPCFLNNNILFFPFCIIILCLIWNFFSQSSVLHRWYWFSIGRVKFGDNVASCVYNRLIIRNFYYRFDQTYLRIVAIRCTLNGRNH